ncbi:MAG: DUF177 domain-containing protein [Candidatus Saganbacteria bacterium]|nr:DUF177 domain-containing protein [Candidatus Saganbacteria bacterium]
MKIDVSQILKAVGNEERAKASEEVSYPELNIVSPVDIDIKLLNIGKGILLNGTIATKVRLNCCRCLLDFELPLDLDIEEEYSFKPARLPFKKGKREIELKEEDFVFEIEPDNTIDLGEAIRQNIITALPIKPLCSDLCKGIRRET